MNKLLVLALLGCALALATASEEEEQSLRSLEGRLVRDVREADPGRKNNKRKNNKRKNKTKKRKNNKKNKTNKKKNNKRKNNKRKNNKRKNNKRKNNKRKNNKRKNNKIKNNKRKNGNGRCLAISCVDNAVAMMKIQTKVSNYKNQKKRIDKKKGIADKKSNKSDVFSAALQRLISNAGGNSSAPMCGTSADNAGALQMKNLTETLTACDADVTAACMSSADLTAPNATEVEDCEAAMEVFEAYTTGCMDMSGADACTCWEGNDDVNAAIDTIKDKTMCDLKDKNGQIVAAVKACTKAFGKCRKFEDGVASVISTCNQDPDKLKAKLANLQANSKAVGDVNDKITSATSARSVTSGAIFIEQCGLLLILIGQDPSNFGILAMGEMIVAFDGTFTDAELETLVAVGEDMADALVAIDAEAAAVLATYLELTGEELSEEDIAALEGGDLAALEGGDAATTPAADTTVAATTVAAGATGAGETTMA